MNRIAEHKNGKFTKYPVVYKMKGTDGRGLLEVIYSDHTEIYKLDSIDQCDGAEEIKMVKGNGFKRVHDGE